jgi:membrane fusion protein (multidrug efflux system)
MKIGRIVLLLGLLLAGIIIYLNKCRNVQSEAVSGKGNTPPLMVNGIIVLPQSFEEKIYASGTLLANEEVEIRNEIAGRITALVFKEGSKVRKGDLLLTLYDDDLLAQLKKLELQKEVAEKIEQRQKELLEVNGISQQEYDISLNELLTIKADIEMVQSNLSKTRITSPFDGIIGLKTVSTGAYITVNTRIATIQSIDPIKLEFALPERYRPMINDNTTINFTTESSEGIHSGKMYAFEPKIDLQTRSVLVRALCPNDDSKLFPGAFAHVESPLKKIDKAILIPTQALIPELKGVKVFVSRGGKAEKIPVQIGMRNDSTIQITSGIQEGDTVLVTGLMQMRPGMPLKITIKNPTQSN